MSKNISVTASKKEIKPKWTKKKIIAASIIGAAILAAVIFGILVVTMGLERVKPIKSTKEEAAVVGECAGYEVKYEELRYITLVCREELDARLGEYDTLDAAARSEYEAELETLVFEKIKSNYIVLSLCDEYGIDTSASKIDRQVQKEIEALVEERFNGDFDSYKSGLANMGLNDSLFRLAYKVDHLETLLLERIVEEAEVIKYSEENIVDFTEYVMTGGDYVRTIHAYYPKISEHVNTSNSKQRAEETAELLASITDGEARYSAMCSAIGAAPFVAGISMTNDGIYFTYGQMGEEYESAAFSLDYFGVSGVVETSDGYYVIMRLEPDAETVRKKARELLVQYKYVVLKEIEDGQSEKIEFVPNEYFASVSLLEIK